MTVSGFFFQAEDGIRDLVRSRGLGDVYKRQDMDAARLELAAFVHAHNSPSATENCAHNSAHSGGCLLYTSDAADERSSVDLGGRRIIKQKK